MVIFGHEGRVLMGTTIETEPSGTDLCDLWSAQVKVQSLNTRRFMSLCRDLFVGVECGGKF